LQMLDLAIRTNDSKGDGMVRGSKRTSGQKPHE
jgi:hypothetical protein